MTQQNPEPSRPPGQWEQLARARVAQSAAETRRDHRASIIHGLISAAATIAVAVLLKRTLPREVEWAIESAVVVGILATWRVFRRAPKRTVIYDRDAERRRRLASAIPPDEELQTRPRRMPSGGENSIPVVRDVREFDG